uniref:Eco57I restriction-modification methylase domain-containing protein n=1 Tax=Algoriphagus sp. TaxID=1872435 RepID=UPI004047E259
MWQSLITTFTLFEYEQYGKKLGISPLGAGIFSPNALGIISSQLIDNETLLRVLRYLVTFENEQGQRVRVNYADLDVEEFGSVYEGLLDYDPEITDNAGEPIFGFVKGDDRSSSGSHYTPEELVRPLIKHSLDYLIEDKLKEADPEKGLLSLTICDVACGSGHILLSAARRVGFELAKVRSKEDQPTPSVFRVAVRDVIRHCIYGVDLNPLAVELCKVALWLEAHEPGEPLNFLDHHIKCGNAIVGLAHAEELEKGIASEAFKTLPGDDKEIASAFKKRNDLELKTSGQLSTFDVGKVDSELKDVQGDFLRFAQLPEDTLEQIAKKEKAYQDLTQGKKWWRLKNLADLQVAQFFIPKTIANKEKLTTHSQYMTYVKQGTQIFDRGASMAISQEKRFFHWFLEFPEVFQKGGFDCILGNPPFLGGQKLSGTFGDPFLENVKHQFAPIGAVDLVTFFFRRIFTIIKTGGFQSLISTNTIAQGRAREDGLDVILMRGGSINHAVKSMKWPGVAAVEVSLVSITKRKWIGEFILNGKLVKRITPYLDDSDMMGNPHQLLANSGKSFQGSIVLGKGFVLEPKEAKSLIAKDLRNKEVLFPYISGEDLNNNPDQSASRWVINFFDWPEEKAKKYHECYDIINKTVKPERQRWALDKNGNEIVGKYALRKPLPEKWWIYGEKRPLLYKTIEPLEKVLVVAQVSKTLGFVFIPKEQVISMMCIVLTNQAYHHFSIIKSQLHKEWVYQYASALKSDIRYTPSDVYETFPLPLLSENPINKKLDAIGEVYHETRGKLMLDMQLGLTKTYNLFNSNAITVNGVNKIDKQVSFLQKHLEKTPNTISFHEAIQGVIKLRELHKEMDESVLEAYGWHQDDSKWGKNIQLRHDFYEVDYLPENDRVRYTIHPEARKEVLKRLLQLNHERHADEVAAGLHDKKGGKKNTKEKKEKSPKKVKVKEPQNQEALFFDQTLKNNLSLKLEEDKKDDGLRKIQVGSVVKLQSKDGRIINIACGIQSSDAQSLKTESAFVQALLGKSVGQWVKFGNGFEVLEIKKAFD